MHRLSCVFRSRSAVPTLGTTRLPDRGALGAGRTGLEILSSEFWVLSCPELTQHIVSRYRAIPTNFTYQA